MKELKKIKYWLFDLDNTLYSGDTKVFDQVDKKMSSFISKKLNIDLEEAKKIQKNYFHEYNTTLNGMIKNHLPSLCKTNQNLSIANFICSLGLLIKLINPVFIFLIKHFI